MSLNASCVGKTWHLWQVDRGDTLPLGKAFSQPWKLTFAKKCAASLNPSLQITMRASQPLLTRWLCESIGIHSKSWLEVLLLIPLKTCDLKLVRTVQGLHS